MLPVEKHSSPPGVECKTNGTLVFKETAQSRTAWFSVVQRHVNKVMDWELKSPLPTLLWMRQGFREFRLNLDGGANQVDRLAGPAMVFVPAKLVDGRSLDYGFG